METPGPVCFDALISLWVPTRVDVWEHVLPNTGWSLLYYFDDDTFTLRFLCETPAR